MECHDNDFTNNEVEQQIQEATRIGETNPSKEASSKGEGAKGEDAKGETNTAKYKASSKGEGAKGEDAKDSKSGIRGRRIIGKRSCEAGVQQDHRVQQDPRELKVDPGVRPGVGAGPKAGNARENDRTREIRKAR